MKSGKEASKCREWEKVRRDKLNNSFVTLSKLLPSHDPSLTLSKIDILHKATEYIEELQTKLKDVLTGDGIKKTEREEIKALYERIRKLLLRNEQLCSLLKEAGIRIPSEYGTIKNFKEPLRWANKISPEQAKEFVKGEAQKENKKEINKVLKKPKLKNDIKKSKISPASKHRKRDPKKSHGTSKISVAKKSTVFSVQLSSIMPIPRQTLPTVSTQSCLIITNSAPIGLPPRLNCRTNKAASTIVTNSSSLITPKMASTIKPSSSAAVPKVNATLGSLGPGTLILANGNIVPIIPQPTVLPVSTILTNPTSLLLKPPNSGTTLIVMSPKNSKEALVPSTPSIKASTSAASVTSGATKVFANIRPKIGVTRTTQVNKVPIPALTSRYSDLPLSSTKLSANEKVVKKQGAEDKSRSEKKAVKVDKNKRKAASVAASSTKRIKTDTKAPLEKSGPVVTNGSQEVSKKDIEQKEVDVASKEVKTISDNSKPADSNTETGVPLPQIVETTKTDAGPELPQVLAIEIEQKQSSTQLSVAVNNTNAEEHPTNVMSEVKNDVIVKDKVQELPEPEQSEKATVSEEVTKSNKETSSIKSDTDKTKAVAPSDYQLNSNQVTSQKSVPKSKLESTVAKPNAPLIQTDAEVPDKSLELGMNLAHSELSNDIFSSLQVPIGGQNPESTSPTAAFLLAFPLVSSLTGVKVTEVIEEENSDSRHGTPTLLQIGTMDTTKTTQSVHSESLTPNLLNLDNFSFFSGKDMCSNFYSSFDNSANNSTYLVPPLDGAKSCKETEGLHSSKPKIACEPQQLLQKETAASSATNSAVVYTSTVGQTTAKSSFLSQNTSVSYSKSISSSYGSHGHYDGRLKTTTTAAVAASSRKSLDPILTSQYNTSTSTTASVAQCNAFNPFSDFSKPNAVHSYATFSKPYGDPLYTNSTHYNYPHHNENNFEQGTYYPTKSTTSKTATYYSETPYNVDCKPKRDPANQRHHSANYYNPKAPLKEKFPAHAAKSGKAQPKPPINWMTTPDFRPQPANTEYLVPSFSKDLEYNNSFYSSNSFASTTHTSYFNSTSSMYTPESSLPIISANAAQRNEYEENQFSWSPTKLPQFLETPHSFVSSTLPTLVGDLALGTTQPQFAEQKVDQNLIKPKDSRRSKAHSVNYDNPSNFLSVSQLVENKTDPGSSSRTTRRNSGNRTVKTAAQKASKHSHKPSEPSKELEVMDKGSLLKQANVNYGMQVPPETNWMPDCNKARGHKNPQSSYSAEALIGHQDQDSSIAKQRYRQQQTNYAMPNKALPIPTFLSDNIVPYFPPVEIPQENNFMQTNPNYQSSALTHSFSTSVQNNAYPAGTYISTGATITSSYLQSSSLIPEFGSHDYTAPVADTVVSDKIVDGKHCNNRSDVTKHSTNRTEERSIAPQQINTDCSANSSNNFIKKKHKHSNENNLPGLVDFGFLSMPSTINSPILPDDFHAHSNFLPPPTPSQLYPCKNPLYSKQSSDLNSGSLLSLPPVPVTRSGAQHFESSAGNAGSSLTSFNLSAIFPEINKGAVPLSGLYSEPSRNKNYNFQRNYLGGAVQVSFNNKSTSSSSYVNSVATSYAPTN